jgi:hypothetical protein
LTDVILTITGKLFGVPAELDVRVLGGPVSVRLSPQQPINLVDIWNSISQELEDITGITLPNISSGPWARIFRVDQKTQVTPALWFGPSGTNGKAAIYLQLDFSEPIGIGGTTSYGGLTITLEPNIQVYSLYVGYVQGVGVDLRAKIAIPTQTGPPSLTSGAGALTDGQGQPKFEIVTYPFPLPAQNSVGAFQMKYLGIGQRVGPRPVVNVDDPMAAIFHQLETELVGDDPKTVLTRLANDFYHPDRNWFIAADLAFRGWELRVLFNDPAMYGLELSAPWTPLTPFSGLLIEILYQKLGPNLGVYYGALTLPYFLRRIVIEGVILILPGFSVWIYTNGDFRVNVGWPLGQNSIGIQVSILIGIAGFYFAKLRSGDNPGAQPGPTYDLILAFGIGMSVYVNESFNASIFSATLYVGVTVTLQGLLAWRTGQVTSGPPDHYWFAGTAGVAVLLQGTIDFAILKASVTVSFTANAGVAFETGYQTLISVSASVSVRVSVKIIFFTIHLSFSTSISRTFGVGSGPPASVNGPLAPGLVGYGPSQAQMEVREKARFALRSLIERSTARSLPAATLATARSFADAPASPTQPINLYFVLQPTASYTDAGQSINLIASLFVEAPAPSASPSGPRTEFDRLLVAIVMWLVNNYSTPGETWSARFQQISNALGSGSQAPPGFGGWAGFAKAFKQFLQTGLTFHITEVDAGDVQGLQARGVPDSMAVLPLFDDLELSYIGPDGPQVVKFNSYNPTPPNYPEAVNKYFEELNWAGSAPPSMAQAAEALRASGSPDLGPSMASYLFYDYFLMQARNTVSALLDAARSYEAQAEESYLRSVEAAHVSAARDYWGFVDIFTDYWQQTTGDPELQYLLDTFDYVSAAGLGSRYMLHGLLLPVPLAEHIPVYPTAENMAPVPTAGLYVLTGQQFAVPAGTTTGTATLSLDPDSPVPPDWITFDSGSPQSATCQIPLPSSVPAKPSPRWEIVGGSPGGGGDGVIQLSELPPLTPHPLYFSLKNQVAWLTPAGAYTILPLPQPLLTLAQAGDGINLEVSTQQPPDTMWPPPDGSPDAIVPSAASLLIRLSISRVAVNQNSDVSATGSPAVATGSPSAQSARYLPYVYQISGTDEATRDLIEKALQQDLSGASVQLLYTPPGGGNVHSEPLSPSVLIAKTNLSTLNQVIDTGPRFLLKFQQLGEERVDFATVDDVADFLRLVWEVSVVNAHGFYLFYLTAEGQDLPPDLFSDVGGSAQSAEFDILVQFQSEPSEQAVVRPWCNSVWVGESSPRSTFYGAVLDLVGHPVPQYAPTYPAGYVGFQIGWNPAAQDSEPEIPVDSLYQMIQFSVVASDQYEGSVWSLPVGPTQNGSAEGSPQNAQWQYQQTVPVYRFTGPPSPAQHNRYDAVGKTVSLAYRLIDIYGNPLPDTHTDDFTPLYQDPLVSIGQWPGVYVDYYFDAAAGQAASLIISISFDPESIVPRGESGSPSSPSGSGINPYQQWLYTLERYGLILDQMEDPHTSVRVLTSLSETPPGGSDDVLGRLREFVRAVEAQIRVALSCGSPPTASPCPEPQPVTEQIVLTVPFASVVALPFDIVPVTVSVEFERDPALVYPPAIEEAPTTLRNGYAVPAKQTSDIGSPFASPTGASGLTWFATLFEAAFDDFDGAAGVLKLAQRSGVQTGQNSSEVTPLWAVRWGPKSGISVQFDNDPIYFALKPLSTKLMTQTVGGVTYSNVDLDAWALEFLAAADAFLTPRNAVAIALLDGINGTGYYEQLMGYKESLADSIPHGLINVLVPQAGEGDMASARERLKQSLLTSLSSAFAVSTVMQIPASVAVVGDAEAPASPNLIPPKLFGSVGPLAANPSAASGSPVPQRQYTLSNGELDVQTGQQWMTVLVSVAQPEEQTELEIPLGYQVSYLQHDFQPSEKYDGYVPSSWLKFMLPDTPQLNMPITGDVEAHIPIPLIFYPQTPVLMQQTATAANIGSPSGRNSGGAQQEIIEALEWDYETRVSYDWARQDELWFTVTYNLPVTAVGPMTDMKSADPTLTLFEALAGFRETYAAISPSFDLIAQEAYPHTAGGVASPGTAGDLVASFARQMGVVADAWKQLAQPRRALLAGEEDENTIIVDNYYMQLDSDQKGVVNLFAASTTGENPQYWPSVTPKVGGTWQPDRNQAQPVGSPTVARTPQGCSQAQAPDTTLYWWMCTSPDFGADADFSVISYQWGPLNILERQTATTCAYIMRNANLLSDQGIATNPAFIYTTPSVQFASPIIPLIQRGALTPLDPGATLVDTIESILQPIAKFGQNLNPLLRIKADYDYQLAAPPAGSGGPGVRASSAILMADNIPLDESSVPLLAAGIGAEVGNWHSALQPSASQALLTFGLTLFGTVAGRQLPLVQIQEIPVMVSGVATSWWTSPSAE